jgi:ABC-type antimicrobial peptide transport system, ATPase component
MKATQKSEGEPKSEEPETPASSKAPTNARDAVAARMLSKTFSHKGIQQHVLKNLDVVIRRGDFTVIMGPSGAGKSTLLYALSGMDKPSLGSVMFDGADLAQLDQDKLAVFRRNHCGFVFQQINLLDSMSLMDNVMAPGLLIGKRKMVAARANTLFDLVGLDNATRKKFPGMISGGEAQRAAIVRALINEPEVLFADEPTGQLNSENSQLVLDLLSRFNRAGQTVVMVTHDLTSALRGNRILYLRDGTVQGELKLDLFDSVSKERREGLTAFLAEMGW